MADIERAELSAKLWAVAEHYIVGEWICCEPLDPSHHLCAKGYAALGMVKTLLVDGDPEKVWKPNAPLLDLVLSLLSATADQAVVGAERDSLGREADRLRKDWVEMRTRAERAEAEPRRLAEAQQAACGRSAAMPSPCSAGDWCCEGPHEAQQAERPRCPHCQLPHDLTPSMMLTCASIGASIDQHSETTQDEHVCKPGASICYCPASGENESDCHGGFDVCCDRPDLHQPAREARQDGES